MNREQEHYILKQELNSTPASLDNVFAKAQKRAMKRTIRNSIIMPLSSCAAVFLLFVGLVNFSPVVASALEHIPGLQRLAEYVTFSSSLSDAVDHGYVQSLGLEQRINEDVTMRVEHIIIDGQMLHIFYSFESSQYDNLAIGIGARGINSGKIYDCCLVHSIICECGNEFMTASLLLTMPSDMSIGQMQYTTIGFDETIPHTVIWEGSVRDISSGGDSISSSVIGEYTFVITIDDIYEVREIIDVNYRFEILEQYMTITTVEINPIHTRVNIETDWANNEKQLQRLVFYMENEKGDRFYPPTLETGGLINLPTGGSGNDGPRRLETHFLESAFFAGSESLTIYITGVEWIGMQWMSSDTIILEEPIIIQVR